MHSLDGKSLRKAQRNIKPPFSLSLEGSDNLLTCERLLRVVPGTRAVLLGTWGQKQVIAKLYYRALHIQRHLKREAEGTKALIEAGVSTAQLLYVGKARNTAIGVLLFEYIYPASHFEGVWTALEGPEEKRHLLCQLVSVVAKMHKAGLRQRDLHFNNFLLGDHTIYSIDGATVEKNRSGHPLKTADSLDNLASLFSQLTFQDTALIRDVVPDYARVREWKCDAKVFEQLRLRIERCRSHRIRKHLKKIFRESAAIICQKSFGCYMLCKRVHHTPAIEALLDNPDWFLDKQRHMLLKTGNTSTVGRVKIGDRDLVVKRYNMKNMGHRLQRFFRATRAAHSWRNAHLLLLLGISTPSPIAVLEKRFGPFRGTAYFISEYVEGPHAAHFFKDGELYEKKAVAQKVAQILKTLERERITHGDMKATNLIVHREEPVLTDLDAMRLHTTHRRFAHSHRKDMDRFFQNWKGAPDVGSLFKELVHP